MVEVAFPNFAQEHIVELDQLGRRYGEYRISKSQAYLDELGAKVTAAAQPGYQALRAVVKADVEQICGWWRPVTLFGTSTSVNVAFGIFCSSLMLAGGWPFAGCWTGISIWIPSGHVASFQKLAEAAGALSEAPDRDAPNWRCWRPWLPLGAANIEVLHDRIVGPNRGLGQDEIVKELQSWRAIFDQIQASASSV
jgi:hypothetical protein